MQCQQGLLCLRLQVLYLCQSTNVFSTLASRCPLGFAKSETREKGRLTKLWAKFLKNDRRAAAAKSVFDGGAVARRWRAVAVVVVARGTRVRLRGEKLPIWASPRSENRDLFLPSACR